MDNLTGDQPGPSMSTRKRKAENDDHDDHDNDDALPGSILVDPPITQCPDANAPRRPASAAWLGPEESWPSATPRHDPSRPTDTPVAMIPNAESLECPVPKRRRIDDNDSEDSNDQDQNTSLTTSRTERRHEANVRPAPLLRPAPPHAPVVVNPIAAATGTHSVTSAVLPAPSRRRPWHHLRLLPCSINMNSPHIPYTKPLVNRHSLLELDIDAILMNPQLRHDMLFEPGLQFRPVSSSRRRHREHAEAYWAAVLEELDTGCTCVTFDMHWRPHHTVVCACSQIPLPLPGPMVVPSRSMRVLTVRMPSRIRYLLSEFLETFLSVIQPQSSLGGVPINPITFQNQMRVHEAHAAYLRNVWDPKLIEQELKHGIFDPSGMFRLIGDMLKSHCAPMRDHTVDEMVAAAQTRGTTPRNQKWVFVAAIRQSLDILECMKLDVANHQLQSMRPWLHRFYGRFELQHFAHAARTPPEITRAWIRAAHEAMLASPHPLPLPHCSTPREYSTLPRNSQIYVAIVRGLTDLVFSPPSTLPADSPPASTPVSPASPTTPTTAGPPAPTLGYPETLWLDNARLVTLGKQAADIRANCMLLLLYRQLLLADTDSSPRSAGKVQPTEAELVTLKNEIRDIGPTHLGYCLTRPTEGSEPEVTAAWDKWQGQFRAVILQVAMRAKEARTRSPASSPAVPLPLHERVPDPVMLKLAEGWSSTNMHSDSPLCVLLRDRLRDVVSRRVIGLSCSKRKGNTPETPSTTPTGSHSMSTGMEPLETEIRALSEKIWQLADIHLTSYLPLYEQEDFLDLDLDVEREM